MKVWRTKPYYSSITIIILPLIIFLVNQSSLFLFGEKFTSTNPTDIIFHLLGGVSIYLASAGVIWHLVCRKTIILHDENVFRFLAFGVLCFAVIGWEVLEYVVYHPFEFLTYTDTISDMICGLIGGFFSIFLIRNPIK